MSSEKSPSIAIVGGGISGLVLAIGLLRRNIHVQIYEQAKAFGEIGAGVAFSQNAERAMKACSPDIHVGFGKVNTRNTWPEKQTTWFDFNDGYNEKEIGKEKYLFSLKNETGASAVHRAHFLDAMVELVPKDLCHFSKHLDTIVEEEDQLRLRFHDGTEITADAVIGCDGIKSRVRAWMVGENDPRARPTYTHKYAYRGLIPVEKAKAALGEDNAVNSKMHMGKDGHILTFPVSHGKVMNVVAFWTNPDDWPDHSKLTLPSKREHVYRDFQHFGPTVQHIISLLEDDLDCWAIFDLGDHPMEFYNKGRVCLLGDAAHATSPHHGSGAGFCIEDAAVMCELLADQRVKEGGRKGIEAAFKAFSDSRIERANWLVQSSRRSGDMYEWRVHGDDAAKIEAECKERDEKIWNSQISDMIEEGRQALTSALA